ncbi:hypothetical protein NX722_01555 [Endozoicomonas gorgoniicola]|uniref:Metal-dependent hydrolase n=1 Tax=Endozoicomonas gorgoniicola TaxID=1234144 RepID=A0ABT3MPQ7_9GAMM|nr:hypothetical protein [Endozoicomonas gorgoniicola]MCW7551347.1 hypothetical protein [Endozoicomonas gorgoniicola]
MFVDCLLSMRLLTAPLVAIAITASVYSAENAFPYWTMIAQWKNPLLFLAGMMAGVRWPDWDFLIPGLSHRSGLTHSLLLPMVVYFMALPAIAAGLSLGIALHLSSDIQPKAWTGGALIKFPVLGSIGKRLSPLWLFINIAGCIGIMAASLDIEPHFAQLIMLMVTSAGTFWYFSREEKRRLIPLTTLAASGLLVHSFRSGLLTLNAVTQLFV